jgi:exopolyphosphatase/pppGpp-phosphohydrolase
MSRLRVWAAYLDPDVAHSERVAQLALNLYDGLLEAGLLAARDVDATGNADLRRKVDSELDLRTVLEAAALLHDVGRAKREENHHKRSYRMIRGLERPLGWSARELEMTAVVARYHRGDLPRPRAKTMQALELVDRSIALQAAAILRLANALDARHHPGRGQRNGHDGSRDGNPRDACTARLEVGLQDHAVVVRSAGYAALDRSAEGVAAARHLLETVLRRPIIVRTLHAATREPRSPVRSAKNRTDKKIKTAGRWN